MDSVALILTLLLAAGYHAWQRQRWAQERAAYHAKLRQMRRCHMQAWTGARMRLRGGRRANGRAAHARTGNPAHTTGTNETSIPESDESLP